MDFRRKNIDLVGKMPLWFGISLALILVGMVSWAAFGLNLGIDFTGGSQFQYRIPANQRPADSAQNVALLGKVGGALKGVGITESPLITGGDTLVVRTKSRSQNESRGEQERIQKAIAPIFAGGKTESGAVAVLTPIGQEFVGPVIGDELKRNAILGVVLGVGLIALWIYIRYNFAGDGARYAVAGIIALLHDVLVLIGLFALIGKIDPRIEIDGAFIAALLTVVGYSINDSVVIFDRLRENLRLRRKEPFDRVVNDSLLETMSRSINTGLTVLIMLFALLWFGGESIYNFVLAMLVGIASGLYSSIFNASMVLVAWHRWDEKKAAQSRVAGVSGASRLGTSPTSSTRTNTRTAVTPSASTTPRRSSFASPTSATQMLATSTTSTATTSSDSVFSTSDANNSSFVSPESAAVTESAANRDFDNDNATQILVEQDGGATATPESLQPTRDVTSEVAPAAEVNYRLAADEELELREAEKQRALQRTHPKARARRRF